MMISEIVSTDYYPPNGLPMMCLSAKGGRLLVLDWFNDKTQALFAKINAQATHISVQNLDAKDATQAVLIQTCRELDEYFMGKRQAFDIPLDLSHGTPFQRQVWQALCEIGYGQTISYKELARRIGKPTAFRACANANGKNLISLIVPCHRVIAADGGLGGYTGGVEIKQTLLALEQKYYSSCNENHV